MSRTAEGFSGVGVVAVGRNCAGNWDAYYRNNQAKGYKDRHYITREFVELGAALAHSDASAGAVDASAEGRRVGEKAVRPAAGEVRLLELGCGVGNAFLPLLRDFPVLRVHAVDISAVAVGILQATVAAEGLGARCVSAAHDIAVAPLPPTVLPASGTVPFVTLIFVLCSVPEAGRAAFLRHTAATVAPGGTLFFRDYCDGDLAQARFAAGNHGGRPAAGAVREHGTFARTNGTLSHFFTEAEVRALFDAAGFDEVALHVVERTVVNHRRLAEEDAGGRADDDDDDVAVAPEAAGSRSVGRMDRRWLQGRFRRR